MPAKIRQVHLEIGKIIVNFADSARIYIKEEYLTGPARLNFTLQGLGPFAARSRERGDI
jgi:hypothetical protein